MALSDVALCARALIMIGAAPISSFEEDSSEAEIARMLYPTLRDGMLASYPWRFAAKGIWLSKLANDDADTHLNGHLRNLAYWPERLNDARLSDLSTV